jgi:hypothetical protein
LGAVATSRPVADAALAGGASLATGMHAARNLGKFAFGGISRTGVWPLGG